jgi:hypothetical protein
LLGTNLLLLGTPCWYVVDTKQKREQADGT